MAAAALLAPLAAADGTDGTDGGDGGEAAAPANENQGSFVCGADEPSASGSGPYFGQDPTTVGVWMPLLGGNFLGVSVYPDGSGSCLLPGVRVIGQVQLPGGGPHLPDLL